MPTRIGTWPEKGARGVSRTIGALFEFSGFPCGLGVCRRGAVYPGSKDPSDELDPCARIGLVTTATVDPTAPLILINPREF